MSRPCAGAARTGSGFGDFVDRARRAGRLVVQPRMGFGTPRQMRTGLQHTRAADALTVGTITLDSYTRTGDHAAVRRALRDGVTLNGYPIVARDPAETRALLDGIHDQEFPVQVRHGSARPRDIVRRLAEVGLEATEGGPVSYCLPYSRVPLREAVDCWAESLDILAARTGGDYRPHVESFGGCMLGQLCPPSLLIAITLLEGMLFRSRGISSMSLSYAQQTSPDQDHEAVAALRRLAADYLGDVQWHIVLYAYMGVYPRTRRGAGLLMAQAATTAVRSGVARVIVKTEAEAHRIPTIAENVRALELAARAAEATVPADTTPPQDTGILAEARALVEAVLNIDTDLTRALPAAFSRGYLDVPYCLHPDNRGETRSRIDEGGRLRWTGIGRMPLPPPPRAANRGGPTAHELLTMLHRMERRYDAAEPGETGRPVLSNRLKQTHPTPLGAGTSVPDTLHP